LRKGLGLRWSSIGVVVTLVDPDRTDIGLRRGDLIVQVNQHDVWLPEQVVEQYKAAKKAGRIVSEGLIGSYIHAGGKIGVLVEVNCETDFVAKTEDFKQFVKDVAMHIAASSPLYVKRKEVPEEIKENERKIYESQAREAGKPEKIIDKIVSGKLDKYLSEICLLEQSFIKDPDKTIQDLLQETIAKLGENISIRRFVRYQLCEGLEEE